MKLKKNFCHSWRCYQTMVVLCMRGICRALILDKNRMRKILFVYEHLNANSDLIAQATITYKKIKIKCLAI